MAISVTHGLPRESAIQHVKQRAPIAIFTIVERAKPLVLSRAQSKLMLTQLQGPVKLCAQIIHKFYTQMIQQRRAQLVVPVDITETLLLKVVPHLVPCSTLPITRAFKSVQQMELTFFTRATFRPTLVLLLPSVLPEHTAASILLSAYQLAQRTSIKTLEPRHVYQSAQAVLIRIWHRCHASPQSAAPQTTLQMTQP